MNVRELRAKLAELLDSARAMVKLAETENRDLSKDENTEYEKFIADAKELENRIIRREALEGMAPPPVPENRIEVPNVNTMGVGGGEEVEETRLFCNYLRTGEDHELQEMQSELRASNDTTMNITTAADGGNLVPTGHYNQIIARRDEAALDVVLGVMMVPGLGTTVGVPYDNEDNGEFVSTAESTSYDRDAPALGKKTLTLVKYTKKVDLTVELLEDNDSNLMAFLADFIGRGKAKTDNTLLLAEVASNGTALKTFASATAIAKDELEALGYNDAIEPYLDDIGSVAWVMRRSVHGEIVTIADASTRRYASNPMGNEDGPTLLDFPIKYSYKSGATAASTKSVYFGNWYYVGKREAPGMSVIRDPYTRAADGEVILTYMYRIVYGVLIAEAIGYGVHPSA
jgi:HK97 family phage major capsid protein